MTGWKTWTGTIGWAVCEGAKSIWPQYTPAMTALQGLFIPLGVIGLGHKLDKASMTYIAPHWDQS